LSVRFTGGDESQHGVIRACAAMACAKLAF